MFPVASCHLEDPDIWHTLARLTTRPGFIGTRRQMMSYACFVFPCKCTMECVRFRNDENELIYEKETTQFLETRSALEVSMSMLARSQKRSK